MKHLGSKVSVASLVLVTLLFVSALSTSAVPPIVVYSYTGEITPTEYSTNSFDNYSVMLNTGDFVLGRMTCDEVVPGGGNRPLDPYLFAYNPSDTPVASNDDGNQPACNPGSYDTACFTFTAATTGNFRFAAGRAAGQPGPYTLVIAINDMAAGCGGVYNPPTQAPSFTSASSTNGTVSSPFNFDFAAAGNPTPTITYSAENLPPGVTRTGNTLSGTPTTSGTYTITATASNGTAPDATQTLTITVADAPSAPTFTSAASATTTAGSPFDFTFMASGNPAPTFSYSDENLPPGVIRTGDTLSGTPTTPGTYTLTATASNGLAPDAVQTFTITVTAVSPTFSSPSSVTGVVGSPFDFTFAASGNPAPTLSYSDENLPPGVTRTGDTLSGTPTTPGTYTLTATASNGTAPDAVQTFTITVNGDSPVFTSPSSATGMVGSPFDFTFAVSGNPAPTLSYSDENLPPGVTRTGDTLSGTPTTPGTYTLTATASNGMAPDAVQTFSITVTGDSPAFTSPSSATGIVGSPFDFTFMASGNPTPTITYSDENLPPGVTRTGDTLSGTPTTPGTYTLTVTANNGQGDDVIMSFTITIDALALAPTPIPVPYAEDVNFDEESVARTDVSTLLQDEINVRELYTNGRPLQQPNGNYYDSSVIGNQGVIDLGILQAIDIFSANGMTYFEGGATFCLRGEGTLIWMAAKNAPRLAEIIGSYLVDDYPNHTCATLFEPGTLVLVNTMTP